MSKEIAEKLRKALICMETGECNSQVIFNAWNENNLQPHESGSYCGACVERLKGRILEYIKTHGTETNNT